MNIEALNLAINKVRPDTEEADSMALSAYTSFNMKYTWNISEKNC